MKKRSTINRHVWWGGIFILFSLLSNTAKAEATGGGPRAVVLGSGGTNAGGQSAQADEFSGAATYSITLPVPPARGGMEPQLVLNYNSFRKNPNSWVGYGWELDLGAIERVAEPCDGNPTTCNVIDYTAGTRFQARFAGQTETLQLIDDDNVAADYGLSLAEGEEAQLYGTKIESAFNYYFHITNPLGAAPDTGWIVIDKSGRTYEFGRTSENAREECLSDSSPDNCSNSQEVARWLLEKVTDPNENTMRVTYDSDRLPSEISYQDITIEFNKVSEEYHYFPTFRQGFLGDDQMGVHLFFIEVKQDGARIQKYLLNYSDASQNKFSNLSSITQRGSNDGEELPPTTFEYYNGDSLEWGTNPITRTASTDNPYGTTTGYLNQYTTLADMNGDGLVDLVSSYKNAETFYVYYNNGNDFVNVPGKSSWTEPFSFTFSVFPGEDWSTGQINHYDVFGGINHQSGFLMDMNGDSLPDRVVMEVITDDEDNSQAVFHIAFNDGNGWGSRAVWLDPYIGYWPGSADGNKWFMDMNGDGLVDRVISGKCDEGDDDECHNNDGYDEDGFLVYYNTGAGFLDTPVFWTDPAGATGDMQSAVARLSAEEDDKIYATIKDINGDGLPDRLWQSNIYSSGILRGKGIGVALNRNGLGWAEREVNADGHGIIDGIDNLGFLDPVTDEDQQGYISSKTVDLIDMNGDGYLDRVEGDESGGRFLVYFFQGMNGSSGFMQMSAAHEFSDPVQNRGGEHDARGRITEGELDGTEIKQIHTFIADMNGDGYPDRVTTRPRDDSSTPKNFKIYPMRVNAVTFSDSPAAWSDPNVPQPIGALKSINDGRGSETVIEYLPSSFPLRWPQLNNLFLPFNLYLAHKIYNRDYTLPNISTEIPEAARYPGMRWTTYNYWGGNFFVRHAKRTEGNISTSYFSQYNGFQTVERKVYRAPAEHWPEYTTTTRYVQARGDVDTHLSISDVPVFYRDGYGHFAVSGRPYIQTVESEDGTVVIEESHWLINRAAGSDNFLCDGTCLPRLESRRKEVTEPGSATARISRVTYEYDDYGNITHERNFDSSDTLLLEKETVFYPPDHFNSALHIRNRPQLQRQKVGDEIYRQKEFDYDPEGNPTLEKFLADQDTGEYATITRTFYENGNLHQITDIDGITKTINYDDNGLFPTIESVSLADGSTLTTTREFNRLTGEISVETGPQGTGKRINYDDFGRPLDEHLRAANGNYQTVKRYAYEYQTHDISFAYSNSVTVLQTKIWMPQPGYPETITDPFQITYTDPSGNVLQECTRSSSGPYRQVVHKITVAGREDWQTEPVYDDDCAFVGTVEAGLRTYKTVKDFQGRTLLMDPPPGDAASPVGEINFSYETDNLRRVVKKTRYPDGGEKQEKFNDTGRVEQLREVNGQIVNYEYNPAGNLRFVRHGSALLTEIRYDLLGRKKTMTDANMGTWTYDYDDYGRLEWQTDNKGQKIHFIYTSLGRIERKEILKSDGSLERYEVYTYDSGDAAHSVLPGELFKIEEYDAEDNLLRRTRYGYDPLYRRIRKITRGLPGVGDFEQTLSHDFRGNLVSTTYPGGETIYYKYGPTGGLTKFCRNDACDAATGEVYYSVDPDTGYNIHGSLLREDFGNGVATTYDYFPNSHRLRWKKTYKGDEIYSERTYAYDEFSNITQIEDPRGAQGSGALNSVGYDTLNRLTSYQPVGVDAPHTLTYSNSGKILTNTASYGANTYRYEDPSHPHAVTRIGTEVFAYDDNGNMTSDASRRMTYNAQNQLVRVEMTNGVMVEYEYDYTGARVKKYVRREDPLHRIHTATTHYLGDAIEIKGDRLFLNIHAGDQKIATKSLGTMDEIIGPAAGSLRNVGINPEWRFSMATPYLMIFFTLFFVASLRPFKFPHPYFPLPLRERVRVRGALIYLINMWSSYTHSLNEAFHLFHHRFAVKLVSLALIFLGLCEFPMMAMANHVDMPAETISDPHFFYYTHGDHLGSSHILTEGKTESRHSGITYRRGQLLQRFEYAPFGQETFVLNPNLKFDPSYTGQTYDIDTGLYYYKSRYYNPKLARFIQPDTIVPDGKDLQSYNRYSYVNNNPLKYTDPTGHFSILKLFGAFFGAFVAFLVGILTYGMMTVPMMTAAQAFWAGVGAAVMGGMAGGLVGGAISGGITGALSGMLFGFAGGMTFGPLGIGLAGAIGKTGAMAVLGMIGASLSYAIGGWQGLVTFGAGVLGSLAGYGLAGAMKPSSQYEGRRYAQLMSDGEDGDLNCYGGLKAGGPGRAGDSEYYRYIGPKEAAEIQETGVVPNVNAKGNPKSVFYTDQKIVSGSAAKNVLSLDATPTHRVTINPSAVRANYSGFTRTGGIEFITRQPIRVDPLTVDVLK